MILTSIAKLETSCPEVETPTFHGHLDKILVEFYQDKPGKLPDSTRKHLDKS